MAVKKKTRTAPQTTGASASKPPRFLAELLDARSPTGMEHEAQGVVDRHMEKRVDAYRRDTMGNRFATVNAGGAPSVLFAGHIDELGLIIRHIDDNGFLYFDTLGGQDTSVISGRRVAILTRDGVVKGVTGKRAIHLMSPEDRKKVPETHEIWIDIGAKDREAAEQRVRIGDCAVYDQSFEMIDKPIGVARAFDDKAGAYAVLEAVRRLAGQKLAARVTAAATTQEEVGTRGATAAAYSEQPQIAVAVDAGHATDSPDTDPRKHGRFKLGGGPILTRGPNITPFVFDRLAACAEKENIPVQFEAEARPTGTDARAIQISREGVATGLVSMPLRYMHTPSEMMSLDDIESTVRLLAAFARSIKKTETGVW